MRALFSFSVFLQLSCVLVSQACPTLCDPMDCSPPGSSVHGILQARILEWVAIPFSRGSSWPRDQIQASCTAGRFFTIWASREAFLLLALYSIGLTQFCIFSIICKFLTLEGTQDRPSHEGCQGNDVARHISKQSMLQPSHCSLSGKPWGNSE